MAYASVHYLALHVRGDSLWRFTPPQPPPVNLLYLLLGMMILIPAKPAPASKPKLSIKAIRLAETSRERRLRGAPCPPLRRLYSPSDLQRVYAPDTNHAAFSLSYRGETKRICQRAAPTAPKKQKPRDGSAVGEWGACQ